MGLMGQIGLMVLASGSARAAEIPRAGVQVSPLSVEREVWPGEEFFFAVNFFNPLDEPQTIRPKFKDLVVSESGEARFLDYSSLRYTISRWADFPKEVITLGPHEEMTLEVGIHVPKEAALGGHFGALFGEVRVGGPNSPGPGPEREGPGPFPSDSGESAGSSPSDSFPSGHRVGQTVAAGTLVFLSVLGEDSGNDDWTGTLSDFSVEGRKLGGVFLSSEPISLRAIFVNEGIFHQNVWGGLSVRDIILGAEGDIFRLREKKALPETCVVYSQPWRPKFPLGKYEASLEFLYGRNGEKTIMRTVSFWVVNPWLLIVLGLGLAGGTFALMRRRRRHV